MGLQGLWGEAVCEKGIRSGQQSGLPKACTETKYEKWRTSNDKGLGLSKQQ